MAGRKSETTEHREKRLQKMRDYMRKRRQTETTAQREQRLEKMRKIRREKRQTETAAQREQRLENMRNFTKRKRRGETIAQREKRLERMRACNKMKKGTETVVQRTQRLEKQRLQNEKRMEIGSKTLTLQKNRSRKRRDMRKRSLQSETQKRRTERLNKEKARRQIRKKNEKKEDREKRLGKRREKAKQLKAGTITSTSVPTAVVPSIENKQHGTRREKSSPFLAKNPPSSIDEMNVGRMNVCCLHCAAQHFSGEKNSRGEFSTCCGGGKIALAPLNAYPGPLITWLCGNDDVSKHFREFARQYNNAFAFASFRYTPLKQKGSGPQTFVIHGQVYHQIADYGKVDGEQHPTYSQLYFLDPDFANEFRLSHSSNDGCKKEIITKIEDLIRQLNPYAHAYMMMKNVIEKYPATPVEMWIVQDKKYDKRRYNLPVEKNQVAAVFTSGAGNEEDFQREICVHPAGDRHTLSHIAITNPNCDPMIYPLLFPHGEAGYDCRNKNCSMLEMYSYRLQIRPTFSPLLHASKLTQQFIVDAYLKVEAERLNWIRHDQAKLRIESYQGLMDFANTQAQQRNLKPGKLFILPSTFTGSKRAMQESYQDCMAMVAAKGKLDIFLTFTCNPKWEEITSSLLPHETPIDRPDVVATVFQLKLTELVKDITVNNVFGKILAYQYVIEFQKRGLPHCHMLIILEESCKIRDPDDIDTVVCAEIPDQNADPMLFNIVCNSMLHGPCGNLNTSCPCTEKDKFGRFYCTKNFPKQYADETVLTSNGYPEYRRRNDGKTVTTKTGHVLDNRWVVPYNKFLCKKYNAHINVEICSTIKSVKYIYKYVYKGHDAALVKVKQGEETGYYNWDEIQAYIDTRYLSAPEAMWRLRKYHMQLRSHAIIRLAVHLPYQQNVVFRSSDTADERRSLQTALQRAERKLTTLLAWFKLNQTDPAARQYLYREIPFHYVQNSETGLYQPRQRRGDKIIPRMYAVSPREIERYSLRLLLLHVRGATCFEDLRTFDGHLLDSFKEAALARQLIEEDKSWYTTMEEAAVYQMPFQLRMLFGAVCEFGYPTNPRKLFEMSKQHLMEDYFKEFGDEEVALNKCLKDLDDYFKQFGHSCLYYGIPEPQNIIDISDLTDDALAEQEEAIRLTSKLNPQQKTAFNEILNAVDGNSTQKCFFVSGAGGCGKTFLYMALITTLLGRHERVKAVAPTGLAATLLKNGQTVHSGFGLPLNIDATSVSRIRQGSKDWKLLTETKLIIWDEISMCTKYMFNAVNRSLQDLLQNGEPFGGIPIVVGGDFRQQAPVLKHANRTKIVEQSVKMSEVWCKFKEIKLLQNMRVNRDEVEFTKWLLNVGDGKDAAGTRSDYIQVPSEILTGDVLTSVMGQRVDHLDIDDFASRAILCPLNEDTMRINERILEMLPGVLQTYHSIDAVSDCETEEEREQYSVEVLNSFTPMGMPPHQLNLKVGCCVMLLRNLNPKQGLCNGTRLIVERMDPNVLQCRIFSGDRKGLLVMLPRLILDTSDLDIPFKFRRKQFPLRLAYSMTITKSQGQTFDKIGIYLPKPVFAHGQLYTALSRVKSMRGLFMQIEDGTNQGKIYENDDNHYTLNCVYDDLLK